MSNPAFEKEVRGAPQIGVELGAMMILIRGKRPGEKPVRTNRQGFFVVYPKAPLSGSGQPILRHKNLSTSLNSFDDHRSGAKAR